MSDSLVWAALVVAGLVLAYEAADMKRWWSQLTSVILASVVTSAGVMFILGNAIMDVMSEEWKKTTPAWPFMVGTTVFALLICLFAYWLGRRDRRHHFGK